MKKMKLIPVKVPWCISPSYEIEEFRGGLNEVSVEVACTRSNRETEKIINELNKKYNNNIPDELWNMSSHLVVELQFEPVFFCKYSCQQPVYELDSNIYDLSLLDPLYDGTLNFHDIWNKKEICPDPGMYEVEGSKLKEKLHITNDAVKHWMIIGHEEEIHVLSRTFTWHEKK